MTTLRLAIDAQGMRSGAQQAQDALRGVQRGAEDAAKSVVRVGTGFRDAAQVTGGFVQTTGNIAALTRQVGDLGTGMTGVSNATNLAGRSLLEFARMGNDLRQLREQFGAVAEKSSTLALLWKAHPLLLVVTGLSVAASVMALFASNTGKAADATDKFAESQRQLASAIKEAGQTQALLEIQRRIGVPVDPIAVARGQREFLTQQSLQIGQSGRSVTPEDLAKILGIDPFHLQPYVQGIFAGPEERERIPADIAQRLIESRARSFYYDERFAAAQRDLGPAPQYGPTPAEARQQEENIERERKIALMRDEMALQEQLNRLYEMGSAVGASLGQAFFGMVTGVNSARQAVALLIQDLSRLAQSFAIRGLADFLGGRAVSAFGPTGTQAASTQGQFTGIGY